MRQSIRTLFERASDYLSEARSTPDSLTPPRITGAVALADQLSRSQSALEDGRAQDVVDELEASLEALSVTSAATWAILAHAFDQLEKHEQRDRAYRNALEMFDRATSLASPAEATALARALLVLDRRKDAIALLRSAAEQDLPNASTGRLLAEQLEEAGDNPGAARAFAALVPIVSPAESVDVLRRAIGLDPENLELRADLGQALLTTGDVDGAIETLHAAVEGLPIGHPAHSWLAEAVRRSGDAETARTLVNLVLEANPSNRAALMIRAACSSDLGELESALADTRRVLELDPDDTEALHGLINLLMRSGLAVEALGEARKLAAARREDPAAHTTLGHVQMINGNWVAAIRAFDRALALTRDDFDPVEIRLSRAQALQMMNELDEARGELDRLLETHPDHAVAFGRRGQVLAAAGNADRALHDFDRALDISAGLTWVLASKADLQIELGLPADALQTLERLLTLSPLDLDARLKKADALRRVGEASAAVEEADAVIAAAPELGAAYCMRGLALMALERPGEAVAAFEAALSHTDKLPDVGAVHALRGQALLQLSHWQAAHQDFELALETKPDDSFALLGRGRSRFALLQLDAAIQDARDVAEIAAHQGDRIRQAEALSLQGEIHWHQGDLENALNALDRALELNPESALVRGAKGQVLLSLGQLDEALQILRAAVDIDPELFWAHAVLAEVLRQQKSYEEALQELERAAGDGDTAFIRGTRGQVLAALERNQEATVELRAAWELEPAPWIADTLAATLPMLADADDVDHTARILDEAIASAPRARSLLVTKAELLSRFGRFNEALAAIERYLIDDQDEGALATKAGILVDLGSYTEARRIADELIERNPEHLAAYYVRVRALAGMGELVRSLREVESLPDQGQDDSPELLLKAWILFNLGRTQHVIDAIAPLLERDPEDPRANAIMGMAKRRLDPPATESAIAHMRRAVKGDAYDVLYHVELADALEDLSHEQEPRSIREAVVEHVSAQEHPEAESLAVAGWAKLFLGRAADAINCLREALQINPAAISYRFALGLALLYGERDELAVDEYEGATRLASSQPDPEHGAMLISEALRDLGYARHRRLPSTANDAAAAAEATLVSAMRLLSKKEGDTTLVSETQHR
jgi:tetratricopeptide (TPR) repeat protein